MIYVISIIIHNNNKLMIVRKSMPSILNSFSFFFTKCKHKRMLIVHQYLTNMNSIFDILYLFILKSKEI